MNKQIKITEKDCIGQLKGYPVQVVQRMVECQVEQGNKADVTVFQRNIWVNKSDEGFDWEWTKEGLNFWHNVLNLKIFDIFFDKYPLKKVASITPHTRFTAKLAKEYGFKKAVNSNEYIYVFKQEEGDKADGAGIIFDAIRKKCYFSIFISAKNIQTNINIPCYLDNIKALCFAFTGKNLEPIKK